MLYNTPSEMAKRILDLFLLCKLKNNNYLNKKYQYTEGEDALYSVIFNMIELCQD